jgi:hypothetical protein
LSHQREKKPRKINKKNHNTTKYPKFKCNTVSVSPSACGSSSVISLKEEKKKKGSGDSSVNGYLKLWLTCPLVSNQLLLEALFMQISGVSLTLT